MIRPAAVLAVALLASQASAFTVGPARKNRGLQRLFADPEGETKAAETTPPGATTEGETEPAEPAPAAPAAPLKSQSMPFMSQPEALGGNMVGDVGFDPLGLSSVVDVRFLREAELKHGRICMLAVVGFIATDLGLHLPGAMHDVGSVAAHDAAVKTGAMSQILLWASVCEVWGTVAVKEMIFDDTGRQPGDFKLDIGGGFAKLSEDKKRAMQLKELKNGRLAMLAFSGIVTQAVLYGKGFPYF